MLCGRIIILAPTQLPSALGVQVAEAIPGPKTTPSINSDAPVFLFAFPFGSRLSYRAFASAKAMTTKGPVSKHSSGKRTIAQYPKTSHSSFFEAKALSASSRRNSAAFVRQNHHGASAASPSRYHSLPIDVAPRPIMPSMARRACAASLSLSLSLPSQRGPAGHTT